MAVGDYPTADEAHDLYRKGERALMTARALVADAYREGQPLAGADRGKYAEAAALFTAAGAAASLALFRPVVELRRQG